MTGVDEPLNQRVHLGDMAGGTRLVGGPGHPDGGIGGVEDLLEPVGQREPRLVGRVVLGGHEAGRVGGCGLLQDLVVDVGHIAHRGDSVAAVLQPPGEDVEDDGGADMAHMRCSLDRGPAVVERHLAGLKGFEIADRRRLGVIESQCHGRQLTARSPGTGEFWPVGGSFADQRGLVPAVSTAVAVAEMPSPRPVNPSPSEVVAETATGAPAASLRTRWASSRRGPNVGRLPTNCTAMLLMVNPACRVMWAASASSTAPEASASSGRSVPKWAPISPSPAAEKRASQQAWATASPSEWPL